MKKLITCSLFAACILAACSSDKKTETDNSVSSDSTAAKPIDTAAMNKAWSAYMTPSTAHQMLAKSNGKWNAEMSFYYQPGQPPSIHHSVCENEMILGGRYQKSVYKGEMDGMPFEGISTMAFDNSRKIYIGTWIDNMGTGVMYLEGTYDEKTKTITMKGKGVDVTTGKDILIRETYTFVNDNTQTMEMFDTKDGKETKSMSIKLTRAK